MRKLWRHEWKYHLFFLITLVLVLILNSHIESEMQFIWWWTDENSIDMKLQMVIDDLISTASFVMYNFFEDVVVVILGGLLVKKGIIYYIEKDSYGREFFQSIPVSRMERFRFHLLMDVLTLIIAVVVSGIYQCISIQDYMAALGVKLEWLPLSFVGMAIINISYLFMLLGTLYFAESIFVSGPMKLIGCCGGLWLFSMVISHISAMVQENPLVQAVYGFVSRVAVPGKHFLKIQGYNYVIDEVGYDVDTYYSWVHEHLSPEIWYKGEKIVLTLQNSGFIREELALEVLEPMNSLYDFSNLSSYIGYAIGYLAIAVILILVARFLTNRQELSKSDFYFGFVKYLVSGSLALAFYIVLAIQGISGWYHAYCVFASLLIFVIVLCFLDLDKTKMLLARYKKKEKSCSM